MLFLISDIGYDNKKIKQKQSVFVIMYTYLS